MLIKQLFRDSFWYAAGLVGVAAIELLRVPLVGGLLGAEEFGRFSLAHGLATLAATIATAWLTTSIVRFLPEYDAKGAAAVGDRMIVRLSGLTVGIVLAAGVVGGWALHDRLESSLQALILPGLMLGTALSFDRIFLSILRARRRTSRYALYAVTQAAIALISGLIWTKATSGSAFTILVPMSLTSLLLLPLAWYSARQQQSNSSNEAVAVSAAGEWWRYGLPLLGVNVLSWVMSNSDRYVLQWANRSAEVGPYAAVHYLSERSIFILTYFLSMSVAPIVFAAWERKQLVEVTRFLSQLVGFVLIAGGPICALLALRPAAFLELLLPPEFATAFAIMPLISTGALLLCLGNVYSEVMTLGKRPLLLLGCYVGGAAIKFALIVTITPRYGMIGCAWGTIVAYATFLVLTMTWGRSILVVRWPWSTLTRVVVALGGMLAAAFGATPLLNGSVQGLAAWTGLALLVYGVILLLLGEPSIRQGGKLLFDVLTGRRKPLGQPK